MISPKQSGANKENAQKSTGPTSPSGKARSSLNALSHGLSSNSLLSAEEERLLEDITAQLLDGFPFDPNLKQCACELGVATIELARVKRAKHAVWDKASIDDSIVSRGKFYGYQEVMNEVKGDDPISADILRFVVKTNPEFALPPFDNDTELNNGILVVAIKELNKLIRYERAAVNRRNRAVRAYDTEMQASGNRRHVCPKTQDRPI